MQEAIEIGYQAFVSDGGEEFGAVRAVSPNGRPELVIYVENAGDFVVPLSAVESVHSQKVILSCGKLERSSATGDRSRARCRRAQRLNRVGESPCGGARRRGMMLHPPVKPRDFFGRSRGDDSARGDK